MKNKTNCLEIDLSVDEKMLDSTARFMFNVFNPQSGNYCKEFDDLLIKGGGGNSMFVNCWTKPSSYFIKKRLSGEARNRLREHHYNSLDEAPHKFKHNNAKGAENRKREGKELHLDHSPGNVKVLELIKEKCKQYDLKKMTYDYIIQDLKQYLRVVQTLDWITVEQDDIRTYKDENYTKKQKDKMNHEERDALLNDTWEYL